MNGLINRIVNNNWKMMLKNLHVKKLLMIEISISQMLSFLTAQVRLINYNHYLRYLCNMLRILSSFKQSWTDYFQKSIALSAVAVEYTDCTSAEG